MCMPEIFFVQKKWLNDLVAHALGARCICSFNSFFFIFLCIFGLFIFTFLYFKGPNILGFDFYHTFSHSNSQNSMPPL